MAIDRAIVFTCKICWILSNVILEQFLFENEKRPFEDLVSDVLKLNGKLFIFTCGKNFCQLKNLPILITSSLFIRMKTFSGGHRKVMVCNGLSKNHNRKKKRLFPWHFGLFDACFSIIHKIIKCVSLTPCNHHDQCKSCQP